MLKTGLWLFYTMIAFAILVLLLMPDYPDGAPHGGRWIAPDGAPYPIAAVQ